MQKLTLNVKFHEILLISSRATIATKFLSRTYTGTYIDTHTDRHFPKIVKLCSEHPKTCKSIKNRKWKFFTKPILSSVYVKESNYENSFFTNK